MESLNEEQLMKSLDDALVGAESDCVECLQNARNAYVSCSAGATPAQRSACLATLNSAIASCNSGPCRKP